MLASVRTRARAIITPHLRWPTGRHIDFNPSLSRLPRCSLRQLSSSRVSRSSSELAFGTAGAPCVIHSSQLLEEVWLKSANNAQATEDSRAPKEHSPGKQATDTTGYGSIGHILTVSQTRAPLLPRARGLILFSARHIRERHPTLKIFAEDKPDLPSGVSVWSPGASCRSHRVTAR